MSSNCNCVRHTTCRTQRISSNSEYVAPKNVQMCNFMIWDRRWFYLSGIESMHCDVLLHHNCYHMIVARDNDCLGVIDAQPESLDQGMVLTFIFYDYPKMYTSHSQAIWIKQIRWQRHPIAIISIISHHVHVHACL